MPRAEEVARGLAQSGSGKSKKRGSVNNARRLDAFAGRRTQSGADWGGADPKWVAAVVVAATGVGGAVTFGTSRDGGAYSLTLLMDGDRETLWFNGDAELNNELEMVHAVLESLD